MTAYQSSEYKIYRVSNLPPGLFGLTYVVAVATNTSGDYYKGEFYVITSRPHALYQGSISISAFGVPSEVVKIDFDFMLREALQ